MFHRCRQSIRGVAGLAAAGGLLFAFGSSAEAQHLIDFRDLSLPPESYYNGADGAGFFTSGGVRFLNNYDPHPLYPSWGGFAFSNVTDATTPGWGNQYAAITGGGMGPTGIYAIGYMDSFTPTIPTLLLPEGAPPLGVFVTNTAYAFFAIRDGDDFADPFGGADGNAPDTFRLIISGFDAAENATGSVDFYLADYRGLDNLIVDAWTWVDLSGLGASTRTLRFTLDSTDTGIFGMNTPAYFALGGLTVVPEPRTYAFAAGLVALLAVSLRRGRNKRA